MKTPLIPIAILDPLATKAHQITCFLLFMTYLTYLCLVECFALNISGVIDILLFHYGYMIVVVLGRLLSEVLMQCKVYPYLFGGECECLNALVLRLS